MESFAWWRASNRAYDFDDAYRIAHHDEDFFPPHTRSGEAHVVAHAGPEGVVVYDVGGVVVTAHEVNHAPVIPAFGYRVDYGGRSVVISGDTTNAEGLRTMSRGADVLVSEVMNKSVLADAECAYGRLGDTERQQIFRDIRAYHIDVAEVAQLALDADVQTLVVTHQLPPVDDTRLDLVFGEPISAIFGGKLVVASDGTRVTLPVE